MGKPASMMSTPMSSSISATSSFSSKVMVAPGHCSPSRKVVSKITTRSFSDLLADVICSFLWVGRAMSVERKKGFSVLPSQTPECPGLKPPRRPSGADKKQKPAEKQGGQGRKRNRRDTDGIGHPTQNSNDF